jgi:hypothetical protein
VLSSHFVRWVACQGLATLASLVLALPCSFLYFGFLVFFSTALPPTATTCWALCRIHDQLACIAWVCFDLNVHHDIEPDIWSAVPRFSHESGVLRGAQRDSNEARARVITFFLFFFVSRAMVGALGGVTGSPCVPQPPPAWSYDHDVVRASFITRVKIVGGGE